VRQAWALFSNQTGRTVRRWDGSSIVGLSSSPPQLSNITIHCARYVDRQGVGSITMEPSDNVIVENREPDENENFLNSDFFALFQGNNVLTVGAGRNAKVLSDYLAGIFEAAKIDNRAQNFFLARVGDPDRLAMIDASGVKSVDLKVDISEAHAAAMSEIHSGDGIWTRAKRAIGQQLSAIVEQDDTTRAINQAQKGTVNVSIRIKEGDLEAAKSGLNNLASAIVDDDDSANFSIVLRNDQVIGADEIALRKRININAVANSVATSEVWAEMRIYMRELISGGQLRN
jgi:hypothetical protein